MASSSSSSNAPQGVTFGVELEMLVPYLWSDEPEPAEGVDTRQVIRLSRDSMGEYESSRPEKRVEAILTEFLRSHDVVLDTDQQAIGPPTGWSIGKDLTLSESKFTYYKWVGIELRSPALLVDPTSFTEVKRVVSLLITSFRLRINETTGFHVHVGLGIQQLPSHAVLRLAKFLWTADGVLSQLHPPERMLTGYCQSIRHESYLARRELDHWRGAENFAVGGGGDVAPASSSATLTNRLAALQQNPDSFPALNARLDSSRLQRLPPVRTNPFEDAGAERRYQIRWGREQVPRDFLLIPWPAEGIANKTRMTVLEGLLALCQPEMYEKATRAVDLLSLYTGERANYNCRAYGFPNLLTPVSTVNTRMTIEFREAAGSLNPSWVAVWARIVSRIVEFCLEAEEARFVETLMRVLEAELAFGANGGTSRYDVIDLINDLGLRDEAKFVEENILIGDKNLFWFPCALGENHENDPPGATIMVPRG